MNKSNGKRTKPRISEYWFYDFVKLTAALPGLVWFRPRILYENETAKARIRGGALVIANHASFSDPILLQLCVWYRRHRFICTKEFFEHKLSGFFFRRFLCIPIDRENFRLDSFREITEYLKRGELVSMFPEGHVNDGAGFASFKSGMVLMAARSGVPIVPVYMRKRNSLLEPSVMVVGEPTCIVGSDGRLPSMAQIQELTTRLRVREDALRARCQAIYPEKS